MAEHFLQPVNDAGAVPAVGSHEPKSPKDRGTSPDCGRTRIATNTTEALIAKDYSDLYELLRMELDLDQDEPSHRPSVSEREAKGIVCAALTKQRIRELPRTAQRTQPRSEKPRTICGKDGTVSVGVRQARWFFRAAGDVFVAARDAGSPTPAAAASAGYPTVRVVPIGDLVVVDQIATIFECPSNASASCVTQWMEQS